MKTKPKTRTRTRRKKLKFKTKIILGISIILFFGAMFVTYKIIKNKENLKNAAHATAEAFSSAAEEINPEQEYYIGRAVAAKLLSTYKLYNKKPVLTAYLNNICAAITINSPYPNIYNGYHVAILDSNEINAFATSGGHIYITLGLINTAKNEDALAGVIAHEVAHIQLKHNIQAVKKSRSTQAWMVAGTAIAGTAGGMDVKQLTDALNDSFMELVQTLVSNGYSTEQEFEADTYALELMTGAGYNPEGLTKMLSSLDTFQKLNEGFGKTHPKPVERIANAHKSMGKYKVTDTSELREKRFAAATK